VLAVLCDAYHEEPVPAASGEDAVRLVLRLHEDVAPYRAAVCAAPRGRCMCIRGGCVCCSACCTLLP
jgi:hypothetical protein